MILKNCDKCWAKISERLYDTNQGICNYCKQEPKPTPKPTIKKEPKVKVPTIKETVTTETFKWLPLYTASYLNNKLKKDFNSIKNETCCVKVWDNYILHTDIINQFKEQNFL